MKAPAYYIAAVSFSLACMLALPLYAQESALTLTPDDLVIEQSLEGGYYLYIRAKKGIGSVLLTESTAHPDRRVDSYAFQNPNYHPANGNEMRMLDGKILDPAETSRYFLVDSTPEPHPQLGSAFRIFIPYVVQFGYEWSRNGRIQILDGSWFNIRTFSLPYADYEGSFVDNPFVVRVIQHPLPPPEPVEPEEEPDRSRYMKETLEAYEEISEKGEGEIIYGKGESDLIGDIKKLIDKAEGDSLDLVLCLDTTKSMENDIPHLKTSLIPMLKEVSGHFARFRFGLVLYRDYYEEYLTKTFPFQDDFSSLQRVLSGIRVFGGRDIPEAVYEALYAGIHEYPWSGDAKMIILVGDAPPHPMPRGRVTKELVYTDAEAAGIELNVIILPQ
ncbi:vWA domain-containing protein [Sediminispirochaeta smaragdinae]|jgi:hypothetical protein|nr:vWA domain-containing protein [Sediminispirochaeta smaragdinae]